VDEEQGIYRGEVLAMIVALANIQAKVDEALSILRDEDDGWEEEEEDS
jgi:hypothetical protein